MEARRKRLAELRLQLDTLLASNHALNDELGVDRPKRRPGSPEQTVEPAVQRPRLLATAQTRRTTPDVGSFLAADSGGAKQPGFSLEIGAGER